MTAVPVQVWSTEQGEALLERGARYVGSGEHKSRLHPSFAEFLAGAALRSNASECPRDLTRDRAQALMEASFACGALSEDWESGFPRRFWSLDPDREAWFEGRLINQEQGWYKGWPVEEIEVPSIVRERLRGGKGGDANRG